MPGDIVALDGGSTTLEIARLLPNQPYTVITNDVYIISELSKKTKSISWFRAVTGCATS